MKYIKLNSNSVFYFSLVYVLCRRSLNKNKNKSHSVISNRKRYNISENTSLDTLTGKEVTGLQSAREITLDSNVGYPHCPSLVTAAPTTLQEPLR